MSRFLSGDQDMISGEGNEADRFINNKDDEGVLFPSEKGRRSRGASERPRPFADLFPVNEGALARGELLRQRGREQFAANNFGLEGVENQILVDPQGIEIDEARFENIVLGNEPIIENALPIDRDDLGALVAQERKIRNIKIGVNVARGAIVGGVSLFVAYKIKKALDAKRVEDEKIAKELLEKEKLLKEKLKKN